MSRFRRELRYLVFKLKDIDRYLSPREREMLVSIENKIIAARDKERRPQLSTVVVERDWPEFEIVWGMIEARMLGVKNKYEVEIEEIQTELSEQCRLLGISAERELKLAAEIERQKARHALLEESYNLLRTEIEAMKRQKPAAWMCPDDPDSATAFSWRPVACELASCLKQRVPLYLAPGAQFAPRVPDGWQPIETAPKDGTHVLLANRSGTRVADGMYGNYKVWSWPYVLVEPAYWRPMPAAPSAQTAPRVPDEIELLRTNAERYEWLRAQHRPVDLPIAQVVWKRNSDPHGEWVNLVDDYDLDRHIDAMLLLTGPAPKGNDILGPEQSPWKADFDAQTNPASSGDPGMF